MKAMRWCRRDSAPPAAYRRAGHARPQNADDSATETLSVTRDLDCAIKGNVSSRGERWFYSVIEAETAGWRAVR
jgi:hypothetical protein